LAQPEDSNELFKKLINDLKELQEYKESLKNPSNEIATSSSNPEKKEPPQNSNIYQLIEECSIAEVKNVVEQPAERRTQEPEHSLSIGYEHLSITPETESDEVTESSAKNLLPIPRECEVTSEDKRNCDVPVCEDSSTVDVCDNHSEILSDSKNDDDISSDDDSFEDIEYVDALVSDPEIVSVEEENVVQQEEEEIDLEDISQIQDVDLREKLLSITRLISNIKSLNDNPNPDRVLNSSISNPIFEKSDNSLSDNFSPEFETFCDHTKETRNGNTTTHADNSLLEYDSFCFEIEPDKERLINVAKNNILIIQRMTLF
nr:hypothetical protein [Tanacetum cinerariifolium]